MIKIRFSKAGDVIVDTDPGSNTAFGYRNPEGSPLQILVNLEEEKLQIPCRIHDDLNGPNIHRYDVPFDNDLRVKILQLFNTEIVPRMMANFPELIRLTSIEVVMDPEVLPA